MGQLRRQRAEHRDTDFRGDRMATLLGGLGAMSARNSQLAIGNTLPRFSRVAREDA